MTGLTIIKDALQILNVLAAQENPSGDDSEHARVVLNYMLDQWTLENLIVMYTLNETFNLVSGTSSYTIGPSASAKFNTTRPVKITQAFVRDGTYDTPLAIIGNTEFQDISAKSTSGTPTHLNYTATIVEPAAELTPSCGTIRLWPVPDDSSLDIGLSQFKQFTNVTTITSTVYFPPGYASALGWNLALELAPRFGKQPTDLIVAKARETKANIKRLNMEDVVLVNDYPASGSSGGKYNIYTDD